LIPVANIRMHVAAAPPAAIDRAPPWGARGWAGGMCPRPGFAHSSFLDTARPGMGFHQTWRDTDVFSRSVADDRPRYRIEQSAAEPRLAA